MSAPSHPSLPGAEGGRDGGANASGRPICAAGQSTEQTAYERTCNAIQSIMFGDAFDSAAWQQVQSFASEKAREMRTERLKRGSRAVSAGCGETDQPTSNNQPRKILKVRRQFKRE